MRLNQYLAAAGVGSRRECDEIIRSGQVRLNGEPVESLAVRVQPGDVVKIGNKVIRPQERITVALNKPRGVVCTCDDPQARRTVLDYLPPGMGRLFPIGRLDLDSEGLLLLTNDGELSNLLTHPRHGVEKEYHVTLDSPFDLANKPKLLQGFVIEGGRAKMESVRFLSPTTATVILRQGIKRQIRLMFWKFGCGVKRLRRVRIGTIKLGSLAPGAWRRLTEKEIAALRECALRTKPAKSGNRTAGRAKATGANPVRTKSQAAGKS